MIIGKMNKDNVVVFKQHRGRGRKRKSDKLKKCKRVTVRMTEEEYDTLLRKSDKCGIDIAKYVRKLLFS
jgi:predicted DNA binding CopG/RHH family protein